MNTFKRIAVPVIAGVVVALIIIALVQSALISSKPISTRWNIRTSLPVEKYYNIVTKILEEEPIKCIINTPKSGDTILIIPLSYGYTSYKTMREVYVALNSSYSKVSKIIVIPYTVALNITSPSPMSLTIMNYTLKMVEYCKENGFKKFLELLKVNSSELKRELSSIVVKIPYNETRQIFSLSLTLARASALYGLLQKLQYYSFISQISPVFIVCNMHKHICVASTLDRLNTVIYNVKTEVPYGLK